MYRYDNVMSKRLTTEQFVSDAKRVHGDKYSYTNSIYITLKSKMDISCPIHGVFKMNRDAHIHQKQGCPKCGRENARVLRTYTLDEFVERAHVIHNRQYDYSTVKYVNSFDKVEIICPAHGPFWQMPIAHTCGEHGCPQCAVERRHGFTKERFVKHCSAKKCDVKLYLLEVFNDAERFIKIGLTSTSIIHRFCNIQYDFKELRSIIGSAAYVWELEKKLHLLFKSHSYEPLTYFKGHTECYRFEALDQILKTWRVHAQSEMTPA